MSTNLQNYSTELKLNFSN